MSVRWMTTLLICNYIPNKSVNLLNNKDNNMFTSPNFFIVPSEYTSAAAETASLVTGSAALVNGAKFLAFSCVNTSASAAWVQVFDGNAAPAGGAVPKISKSIAATSDRDFSA